MADQQPPQPQYQQPVQQAPPAQSRPSSGNSMITFGIVIVVMAVLYSVGSAMGRTGIDAVLQKMVDIGFGIVVSVGAIGSLILPGLFYMLRDKK